MAEVVEKKSVEAVGQSIEEVIYDSPPSESDDDLWLAQGAKMLEESVPGVRNAASELIKALGLLQTVYLGILGFAKFIPENMEVYNKALFIVPIVPWVVATYYCLRVMKTEIVKINLRLVGRQAEQSGKCFHPADCRNRDGFCDGRFSSSRLTECLKSLQSGSITYQQAQLR